MPVLRPKVGNRAAFSCLNAAASLCICNRACCISLLLFRDNSIACSRVIGCSRSTLTSSGLVGNDSGLPLGLSCSVLGTGSWAGLIISGLVLSGLSN